MRLMDLLDEGLKRSMDKLKEKERDKVRLQTRQNKNLMGSLRKSSHGSEEFRLHTRNWDGPHQQSQLE